MEFETILKLTLWPNPGQNSLHGNTAYKIGKVKYRKWVQVYFVGQEADVGQSDEKEEQKIMAY